MTKPKLAIAPRKPIDESAARKIEEALERKSEGVAGVAHGLVEVPADQSRESNGEDEQTPRTRKSNTSQKTSQKGESKAPSLPAPANTGLGTRANPRVRKTDGIKTRSTSIHLPIELGLRLTMFCARNGRRQSEIIALAVGQWLDGAE